jgi:hypothetical protein
MDDPRQQYINYAIQQAQQYNLPVDLFLGQLEQESNWNPQAVSKTGAKGIGQFKEQWHPVGTWKFQNEQDYFDPYKSIESAAMYMNQLNGRFGNNYDAAIAAYNGGTQQGRLVQQGGAPDRAETANYIPRIHDRAKSYSQYMHPAEAQAYQTAMIPQQQPQYPSIPQQQPQQPRMGVNPYANPYQQAAPMQAPMQLPQQEAPQPQQFQSPFRSPYGM